MIDDFVVNRDLLIAVPHIFTYKNYTTVRQGNAFLNEKQEL
jgi:hypothetical protein